MKDPPTWEPRGSSGFYDLRGVGSALPKRVRTMRSWVIAGLLLTTVAVVSLSTARPAQGTEPSSDLGTIAFPTSGTPDAQRHFLRGVSAMHSFWYEEALAAFRESTRAQPDFLMGYWGEAMAHTHPIWEEQDLDAARAVLAHVPKKVTATARERAYFAAVQNLYGEGDESARANAYAAAMQQLHHEYPDDLEAACFSALALLGTAHGGERATRTHIQAGALTLEVLNKNPNHPGAAHYTIHAFDDPDHAILALPAARRYAQIAPEAHHALHMPAHIFLQLGMWPEAAAANTAGWRGSVTWVDRERLPINLRDYHSLQWLQYVFLQQGRYRDAEQLMASKRQDMRAVADDPQSMSTGFERSVGRYYERMAAAFVLETQNWESAATLAYPPGVQEPGALDPLSLYTLGFAAAMQKDSAADEYLHQLNTATGAGTRPSKGLKATLAEIRRLELAAVIAFSTAQLGEALSTMRKAVTLEEALPPPSGPPRTIKPPHELLGEFLLAADSPAEARTAFETALYRHPNRARSLLGLARAADRMGDRDTALTAYGNLLEIWQQADGDLPELREAMEYSRHNGRAQHDTAPGPMTSRVRPRSSRWTTSP